MEEKGFVLTLDALVAVMLLGVFMAMLSFELVTVPQSSYVLRLSSDFMTVIDAAGILKNVTNQSGSEAVSTLSYYLSSLPPNVGANLTVRIYEFSGGDFSLKKNATSVRGVKKGDITVIKRLFMIPRKSEYGIGYLEVWYE